MDNVGKFLESIVVRDCGLTKIRVGNDGDGGYVVYKELCEQSKVVYSVGVGDDIGFELDWVKKFPNTKFELYDPIIDRLPQEHKRFSFHRFGLGLKYKPLKNIVKDSTLKMDIEWDEWGAFQVFDVNELKKFSQMLVEFHLVHVETPMGLSPYFTKFYGNVLTQVNEDLFASYYDVMKFLANWFYIYHIHANNSLPAIKVGEYMFPPLIELSFIRRDLVRKAIPSNEDFPIVGLDFPNKSNRPDILDYYPMTGESA